MKKIKIIFLISFLLIALIYTTNITGIPKNIILFEGEKLNLGTIFGIDILEENRYETIQASTNVTESNTSTKLDITLALFDTIPVKQISVNIIPQTSVIPIGNTIGLKLYTNGVLVVGMSEIEGNKPYEDSGIEEGDMIVSINENEISSTVDLIDTVNKSKGEEINVKYIRDGNEYITNMQPTKTTSNEYKLGLWVRDAAARSWNSNILRTIN